MWCEGKRAGEKTRARRFSWAVWMLVRGKCDSVGLWALHRQAGWSCARQIWLIVKRVLDICCWHTKKRKKTNLACNDEHPPPPPPSQLHTHTILSVHSDVIIRQRQVSPSWPFCLCWPFQIEPQWKSFWKGNMWTLLLPEVRQSGVNHNGGYEALMQMQLR